MNAFLAAAAASVLIAGPAAAGRFVEAPGGQGASVTITDDGCTASVLFDDARVRGPEDLRERLRVKLPLRIVGASDVSVETRGFAAGSGEAAAILSTRSGDETLFESDSSDDPNWSQQTSIDSVRGRMWLDLSLDADSDADDQTELSVDSIDLSIENCGASSS